MMMKNYKSVLALIAIAVIGSSSMVAQSYYDDDIYYNPDKVKKEKVEKQKQSATNEPVNTASFIKGSDSYVVYSNNNRDVDEYNRRNVTPSQADSTAINGNTDFKYTRRIERFYNSDVVEGSDDEKLRDYYYASQIEPETTTINLIVTPDYGWYSPFYSGWYNPWYYSSWCYWDPWYGPGWWGPSYAWNWGWGPSWSWGWGPAWGPSWNWGWGGSWIPSHGRPYRRPVGAMATHRPAVGTGYRPNSGGGRRGPVVNSNRQPSYNHNNNSGYNPGNYNTGGQRRGGNVRPSNSNSNRDYNINHNNSNSSWDSGSRRGGSSIGSGSSFGGGSRSGGGARGTGGRRR